jgi:hypothetical protein
VHIVEHEGDPLASGERLKSCSYGLARGDGVRCIRQVGSLGLVERNLCPPAAPASVGGAEDHAHRHGSHPRVEPIWLPKPSETPEGLHGYVLSNIARFVAITEDGDGKRQYDPAGAAHQKLRGT